MGKSEIAEIAEIATSRDINLKKRYFQRIKTFEGCALQTFSSDTLY
jgi:hypothetical protein